MLLVAVCAAAWALAPAAPADNGTLYQWTDEQGVVRYTPDRGRVPGSARDVQEIVAPAAPAPEANGAPAPAALPALMGSKLPDELVSPGEPPPSNDAELAAQIAELREAIARDQASLEEMVAAARAEGADADGTRLQAIANRLPMMRQELARLEQIQRERAAGAATP